MCLRRLFGADAKVYCPALSTKKPESRPRNLRMLSGLINLQNPGAVIRIDN